MRRHRIWRGVKFLVVVVLAVTVFGGAVMFLWNALLPDLFGLKAITFVQALGLLVLGRILFGRFGGHFGGHWGWRHRMLERMQNMTPEEQEKFRAGFRGHCGHHRHEEPKASATV
jgi:hypothetical protein